MRLHVAARPLSQVDDEGQQDDPLVAAGVLAPKHAETRAFLEMAGKGLPSQQAQASN